MEPLKLTEPHHMFHGTLGFGGTPVEEHWSNRDVNQPELYIGTFNLIMICQMILHYSTVKFLMSSVHNVFIQIILCFFRLS